jgi:hypothetical protein
MFAALPAASTCLGIDCECRGAGIAVAAAVPPISIRRGRQPPSCVLWLMRLATIWVSRVGSSLKTATFYPNFCFICRQKRSTTEMLPAWGATLTRGQMRTTMHSCQSWAWGDPMHGLTQAAAIGMREIPPLTATVHTLDWVWNIPGEGQTAQHAWPLASGR